MSSTNWWARLLGREQKLGSAEIARQRLMVLVAASDDGLSNILNQDRIDKMKHEVLEVIRKYANTVELQDIEIHHRKENTIDVLEMSVSIPENNR